ncbi:hypothetical protein AUJ17_04795 [Candidatus Micrarchaeota archaeon CG1_02_47_40]|nr:MAG: hypothetical protein AUJ17_04795 [Candidatus Micrarchaeota archaeon CG1_02_47_40]
METSPPWVTQVQTPDNIMKSLQETKIFSQGVGKERLEKFQNWLNDAKQGKPNVSFSQGLELLDSLHGIVREKITSASVEYGQVTEAFNTMHDVIKRGDIKQISALSDAANERFGMPAERKEEKIVPVIQKISADSSYGDLEVSIQKKDGNSIQITFSQGMMVICDGNCNLIGGKLFETGVLSEEKYNAYVNDIKSFITELAETANEQNYALKSGEYLAKLSGIMVESLQPALYGAFASGELTKEEYDSYAAEIAANITGRAAAAAEFGQKVLPAWSTASNEEKGRLLEGLSAHSEEYKQMKTVGEVIASAEKHGVKLDLNFLRSLLSIQTVAQNSSHLNLNASQTAFYNFMFFTMTQQNLNLQAEQRRLLEKNSSSFSDSDAVLLISLSLLSSGSKEEAQKKLLEECKQNEPIYSFLNSLTPEQVSEALNFSINSTLSNSIQIILPPGSDFHPGASFGGAGNLGSVQMIEKLLGENSSIKEKGHVIPSTQGDINTIFLPASVQNEQTENTTLAPLPQFSSDLSQTQKFHAICRVLNEKKNEIESVVVEIIPNQSATVEVSNPYQTE